MRRPACALCLSLSLATSGGLTVGIAGGCADGPDSGGDERAAGAVRSAADSESKRAPGVTRLSNAELEKRIEQEGALSAWAAVRERSRLLARRGQRGLIHGRVGPATGDSVGWRWLIDDTEGQGALAVRVALSTAASGQLGDGDRVVVGGAWAVAQDGGWLWRADDVAAAADAPVIEFPFEPGPAVGDIAATEVPADARGPGQPGPAGPVVLTVVGRPVRLGDGWAVAEAPGDEPVALLRLPGERRVYGGDELLTSDERWQLRRGERYLIDSLPIATPRRADALPIVRSETPPRRIVADEQPER